VKSPPPGLSGGPPLRAREEVLERHVEEGPARLGEDFPIQTQVCVDVDSPPAAFRHPGGKRELAVDEHGPAIADEDARGHAREAVPRGEEPARLVQRRADEPAVDDPGRGLVALAERERRLVAVGSFLARQGEVDAVRVVAATPTRMVVVRRYAVQRRPPRSKWAL
jgi:hypothetical protein